jgi:chloramphenicol-sensitive protein RarD
MLLIFGGIATTIPLICFGAAANKISLNAIGFIQFIAPTLTFILAISVFKEPLGHEQLLSFTFIWLGLLLYLSQSINLVWKVNKRP